MKQVIDAYRSVTVSDEFKEIERQRSYARHNEASAIAHAKDVERAKWEKVIAEKDAAHAAALAEKKIVLAEKDATIAQFRAQLGKLP